MASKGSPGTTTRTEVRRMLQTASERLSAREEKAVRMRTGSGLDAEAELPRRGSKTAEAQAELTALEIELQRKLADRADRSPGEEEKPQVRTRAKDKIIRALRRMK